jgi:putative SOS response-associated peptidase YedK
MCGRLNVIDDPDVIALCETLGINLSADNSQFDEQQTLLVNRFTLAASKISIIREVSGTRRLDQALWWLLLEQIIDGFKASKWTSFNTRYDKLNTPQSAGYQAFRQSRCIIPVKGFGETQGKGSTAVFTDFYSATGAIALGGLCREWFHPQTGEITLSCSVITLPPHPSIQQYHSKSTPLMLAQNDGTMAMWLDSSLTNVELFNDLLVPRIPHALIAQRIDKPSMYQPVAEPVIIAADKS